MSEPFARELEVAARLAREAGRLILQVYATDFAVEDKPHGGGPVTEADERANALIVSGLQQAFPGDGVVAEESVDASQAARERCWFVDPLDGTREFVDRNGMFAVQIGLAVGGEALAGAVYAPVSDKLYLGAVGGRCTLEERGQVRELRISPPGADAGLRLLVSRSHKSRRTQAIHRLLKVVQVLEHGSVGLKCGLLAEGAADLYLHPSDRSYRWDCCGPEAVLRAAGGALWDLGGTPYRYAPDELRNVRGLMGGHPETLRRVLPVVSRVARDTGLLSPQNHDADSAAKPRC